MKKLRIIYDNNAISPRTEFDNLGTIAYKHSRYTLGEEEITDPIDWLEEMLNITPKYEYSNQRLQHLESLFYTQYIALPIYMYEHSGITINTCGFSCRWDSGKVGYIYITKKKALEEWGGKRVTNKLRQKVESCLKAEIKELDTYLCGDVYGFIVEDENGETIDSCWGFYGDNFLENGMLDYINHEDLDITHEELIELLKNTEVEY